MEEQALFQILQLHTPPYSQANYLDFVTLDRALVVAQLSKLAICELDAGHQDRILGYSLM